GSSNRMPRFAGRSAQAPDAGCGSVWSLASMLMSVPFPVRQAAVRPTIHRVKRPETRIRRPCRWLDVQRRGDRDASTDPAVRPLDAVVRARTSGDDLSAGTRVDQPPGSPGGSDGTDVVRPSGRGDSTGTERGSTGGVQRGNRTTVVVHPASLP